ncbi:MAG: UDP-3-O-(3-hydroxymyristoyl)glucosamine N-acyltransferase [Pirellulaceae bacterium]|nr:UDP-3-O-(3-hydroxymyristoyl)glucosamine N-acyltransferase [Pirellulaceae bacterium]
MQIPLGRIADAIHGNLIGSPNKLIMGIALIDEATSDQITLVGERKTLELLHRFPAGAVVVPTCYDGPHTNVIKADNPQLAFAKTIALFHPKKPVKPKISSLAEIHSSATLGDDVFVGPFASIGARSVIGDRVVIQAGAVVDEDVVIGNDTVLSYHVIILPHTRVGARVAIQSGSVIGCEGFCYLEDGADLHKIPQLGHVVIEDDVEIGACNTISRGNLGRTLIRQGVKTGNLVHIGHNVTVGKNTRIVTQAGIAGNAEIGDHVLVGPQVGIAEERTIGHEAVIGPQAGIIADVADGENVFGTPGMSRRAWLSSASLIPQLSEMRKEMIRMTQQLDELKTQLNRR